MTFVPNYSASKRWEKVGDQEMRPTPYKQEIDPRSQSHKTLWQQFLDKAYFSIHRLTFFIDLESAIKSLLTPTYGFETFIELAPENVLHTNN